MLEEKRQIITIIIIKNPSGITVPLERKILNMCFINTLMQLGGM
jgi:hypothetical protein